MAGLTRERIKIQKFKAYLNRGGVSVGSIQEVFKDQYVKEIRDAELIRQGGRKNYIGSFDGWLPVDEIKNLEVVEPVENKGEKIVKNIIEKGIESPAEEEPVNEAENLTESPIKEPKDMGIKELRTFAKEQLGLDFDERIAKIELLKLINGKA